MSVIVVGSSQDQLNSQSSLLSQNCTINDDVSQNFRNNNSRFWKSFSRRDENMSTADSSSDTLVMTKNDAHVLWTRETTENFETWWFEQTFWDINTKRNVKNHRFIQWNSSKRALDVWQDWHEAVCVSTDFSRIICKKCEKTYTHSISENNENNEMISHIFKNEVCRSSKASNQQLIFQEFLKVSYSCFRSSTSI